MGITEPIDGVNASDNLICPRCGSSLPEYAIFCRSCGERIKRQKNKQGEDAVDVKLARNAASKSMVLSKNTATITRPLSQSWGYLPWLSVTSAAGLFLAALAFQGGRISAQWADPMYWLGLLTLFAPIALRIISIKPTRKERIALLIILGSSIYFLRFLEFPLSFVYNDEFLHWRGAIDLTTYGHLFHPNPLLPIGPYYPGMEIVTNALSSMTGLSIFDAGMVLLTIMGLVIVLSLYLFFECLSGSARLASIATLLCIAGPGFLDNTSFAYESLALPLALFVVYVVARRSYSPATSHRGLTLIIWLTIAAVVVTHHITSFGLLAFLLFWTAVSLVARKLTSSNRSRSQVILANPGGVAFVCLILIVAWTLYTQGHVISYLYPVLLNSLQQLIQVLSSQAPPHKFFSNQSGFVEPLWERLVAYASVAFISLGLPAGLYYVWRHYRNHAAIFTLGSATLIFPFLELAHIASIGVITDRASAYLFPAIAFVLALGITEFWLARVVGWKRLAVITGAVAIIFIGTCATDSALWDRLPGPYMVAADQRSIDPQGVTAAEWALSHLGPGNRVAGDLTDSFLMGTYGYQYNVMSSYEKLEVAPVFTSLTLGPDERKILQVTQIQYLVIDLRVSSALPQLRAYFDVGEPDAGHYTSPINPAALAKFDGMQNVDRLFDSGDIVIYNVAALSNGSSPVPAPTPTPIPAPKPAHPKQPTIGYFSRKLLSLNDAGQGGTQ